MVCQTSITETNSGTLYYHSEHLNETSANNECNSSDQGRLAILDTEEKFRDAIEMAPQKRCPNTYYMIGLKKNGNDSVWLNAVRNRLAFKNRLDDKGQCGWISPVHTNYEYKKTGDVFFARCEDSAAFLCFKPTLINNAPPLSTASFMSTVKSFSEEMSTVKSFSEEMSTVKSFSEEMSTVKSFSEERSTVKSFSEKMSFSAKPESAYSTTSPSNMGLPSSSDRTTGSGVLVGSIAAVAVLTLAIVGILAYMKCKKGQVVSGSKTEDHRTHNVRTMPENEEHDVSPYEITTIQQVSLNEVPGEQRSCIGNLTSGIELSDVSPYDITTIATIQQVHPRDNSTTVHKYRQSNGTDFEKSQIDVSHSEPPDQKPQCSAVPLATDRGEAVVYSQVNKSRSA